MSNTENYVHLGVRAERHLAERIDKLRAQISHGVGIPISRAQAMKMLIEAELPRAERRFGLAVTRKKAR